jgi:hypothetical protein
VRTYATLQIFYLHFNSILLLLYWLYGIELIQRRINWIWDFFNSLSNFLGFEHIQNPTFRVSLGCNFRTFPTPVSFCVTLDFPQIWDASREIPHGPLYRGGIEKCYVTYVREYGLSRLSEDNKTNLSATAYWCWLYILYNSPSHNPANQSYDREALHYKPEGRGFHSRWGLLIF